MRNKIIEIKKRAARASYRKLKLQAASGNSVELVRIEGLIYLESTHY